VSSLPRIVLYSAVHGETRTRYLLKCESDALLPCYVAILWRRVIVSKIVKVFVKCLKLFCIFFHFKFNVTVRVTHLAEIER